MNLPQASNAENIALFQHLIGDLEEWKQRLAPNGWQNSPYYHLHHPTLQMRYEEALHMHENFSYFLNEDTPPKLEDFEEEENVEVDERYELKDLLGRCLWTIFSNNHEVINAKGELHDIGSFRGSGNFIADFLNEYYPAQKGFGYLDFYCADTMMTDFVDLKSVYEILFSRLKKVNCDWCYAFPSIHLISFEQEEEETTDPTNYKPEKAMQQQLEKEEKRKAMLELQQKFDEDYETQKEEAKYKIPPTIVQAYQTVYNKLPQGYLEDE